MTAQDLTLVDVLLGQKALSEAKARQIRLQEVQSGSSQEDLLKKSGLVT